MPARNPTPETPPGPVDLTTKARDPLPERDRDANLQQRMLAVMHAIGYIPKEGVGPQAQGGYAYAKVEHIKDAVREACIEHGVMVHVSIDERDIQLLSGTNRDGAARTTVLATIAGWLTFVNVDDPEQREASRIQGQGIDTQDKALSKATTSAIKYGLLNAFTIPTGDDPDASGVDLPAADGPQHATRPSQSRPAARSRPQGPGPGQYVDPNEPPPYGAPASPQGNGSADDRCPEHGREWRMGNGGRYYCSAKDPAGARGYCERQPTAAWMAAHER